MADFWRGSGFRLLDRDDTGRLQPTDDFLRMYLQRPELAPPPDACAAERRLHAALTEAPRRDVSPAQIGAIVDADARENYAVMLEFRDRLLASSSLEGCYLSMFHDRMPRMAPAFVDQLAQLIVRNILDGTDDALEARAGELLFREQRVSVQDGAVLLADAGTVDMHQSTGGLGNIGRLMQERRTPLRPVELKVLDPESSALYWMRDERFDTVLQINASHSREALGRVLGKWIEHFFGTPVTASAVRTIDSARWVWHVGLDAESTRILNGIYNGEEPDQPSLQRILCLFELSFRNASDLRPEMEGRPVSLGLAMTPDNGLRMKPQNLLINLPLARRL